MFIAKQLHFAAVRTQPLKQPLRHYTDDGDRQHIALHTQPLQTENSAGGIGGMDSGNSQMRRAGEIDSDFGGRLIADFADKKNVRVLPDRGL